MSLISESQKLNLKDSFDSIHQTFKKSIKIFYSSKIVSISTSEKNSQIYREKIRRENQVEIREDSIDARILFSEEKSSLQEGSFSSQDQIKFELPKNTVRIKVSSQDFAKIKDAEIFEIDGSKYKNKSVEKPHGLFGFDYYTIFLEKTD